MNPIELLSTSELYEVDSHAIISGIPAERLMENAGNAVADIIMEKFPPCAVLVLCGTGNNGGDGFVIARKLHEKGWDVTVGLLGNYHMLKGEAALNAARYKGTIEACDVALITHKNLVVDALFGVGLNRPLEGKAYDIIKAVIASKIPVVAVDIPSGIHGDSGQVMGIAPHATLTITFTRKKIGHLLQPGREYAGEIIISDIGISDHMIHANCYENTPELWQEHIPFPSARGHKYERGSAMIMGGPTTMTGAAKLASLAALRAGAGLVTIACPKDALSTYAASLLSVMTAPYDSIEEMKKLYQEKRLNTILVGPGNGVTEETKQIVLTALETEKPCVLDADALTVFQENPSALFDAIKARDAATILPPHEGEFKRLFSFDEENKLTRTKQAADLSGAIVVLKGSDTVIAEPNGRTVINSNAPAILATAGSGDVLAGIITGLLASNVEPFMATCMGVWMHGEAASLLGLGMIAEDLPEKLMDVWKRLHTNKV